MCIKEIVRLWNGWLSCRCIHCTKKSISNFDIYGICDSLAESFRSYLVKVCREIDGVGSEWSALVISLDKTVTVSRSRAAVIHREIMEAPQPRPTVSPISRLYCRVMPCSVILWWTILQHTQELSFGMHFGGVNLVWPGGSIARWVYGPVVTRSSRLPGQVASFSFPLILWTMNDERSPAEQDEEIIGAITIDSLSADVSETWWVDRQILNSSFNYMKSLSSLLSPLSSLLSRYDKKYACVLLLRWIYDYNQSIS